MIRIKIDDACRNDARFLKAVRLYREGDLAAARLLFGECADEGNALAEYTAGVMDLQMGERSGINLIEAAAKKGCSVAQYEMANMYYTGQGRERSLDNAFMFYEAAAEQDHAEAQNQLGLMYLNGEGASRNDSEAFQWFERSAENGYAGAQFNLATMYESGQSVPMSLEKAAKWYEKAAEQDITEAQVCIGRMYSNGNGVDTDIDRAMFWFEKAADKGHDEACYNYGLLLADDGRLEEAALYLQKAAAKRIPDAADALKLVREQMKE
ncbi:MAG: sel1 repeat family protein [archaeon]|nr:sel1 repeat family protein [archaeon]